MATQRWLGRAQAVAQVDTCTITLTWAQGDTVSVTINDKSVTFTAGTSVTVTDIATGLKEAINGETLTDTTASYTPAGGGPDIPEWSNITATSSAGVVTLTADVEGVPHTITETVSTAGNGDAAIASVTAATGPNHWDNADNWTSAVPVNSDTVYFDNSDVDVLYGLGQSAVTVTNLHIAASYTGTIGLPKTHADGFQEYRTDYLELSATNVYIGRGDGIGSGRIKLELGSNQSTVYVEKTGAPLESGIESLLLCGSHVSNALEVIDGSVGTGVHGGTSCTLNTVRIAGGRFFAGDGFQANADITQLGGEVVIHKNVGTFTMSDGFAQIGETATVTTLTVTGGNVDYLSSGTITTLNLGGQRGATFDCSRDSTGRTITNCNLDVGGRIVDPLRTITYTNGIVIGSEVEEIAAS